MIKRRQKQKKKIKKKIKRRQNTEPLTWSPSTGKPNTGTPWNVDSCVLKSPPWVMKRRIFGCPGNAYISFKIERKPFITVIFVKLERR